MSRKLLKVAAFEIYPTSMMALFEIHQRFKGHFLNELRVSFKDATLIKLQIFYGSEFIFGDIFKEKDRQSYW